MAARSIRAATSAADTKLMELSPRPNTIVEPLVRIGSPMMVIHVSMSAVARTIVHARPLARAAFRVVLGPEELEWTVGRRPHDRGEDEVPDAGPRAASMRLAFPARSTVCGETSPGPAKPWTADTTVDTPTMAAATAAGSPTSPIASSTPSPAR